MKGPIRVPIRVQCGANGSFRHSQSSWLALHQPEIPSPVLSSLGQNPEFVSFSRGPTFVRSPTVSLITSLWHQTWYAGSVPTKVCSFLRARKKPQGHHPSCEGPYDICLRVKESFLSRKICRLIAFPGMANSSWRRPIILELILRHRTSGILLISLKGFFFRW